MNKTRIISTLLAVLMILSSLACLHSVQIHNSIEDPSKEEVWTANISYTVLSARLPLLQSLIRAPPSLSVLSARMPLSCRASHDFSSSIGILGSLFLPFQTQGTLLSYSESHLRAPAF